VAGDSKVKGDRAPAVRRPKAQRQETPPGPKTAEVIAELIRHRIARGEFVDGAALASEADLVEEFKVSRASLREAMRILEAESLIEVKRGPRGGVRIRLPREETAAKSISLLLQLRGATLKDLFDARIIIEPPLVAKLAHTRPAEYVEVLRRHVEREREAVADFQAFFPLAAEMHSLVVRYSGNVALGLVVGMLDELYTRHLARFISRGRKDQLALNKSALASHEHMLSMIEARDGEGAEVIWRYHLQQSAYFILGELGPDTPLARI
jgi:DNA-binding FadR family transcriptional regulator